MAAKTLGSRSSPSAPHKRFGVSADVSTHARASQHWNLLCDPEKFSGLRNSKNFKIATYILWRFSCSIRICLAKMIFCPFLNFQNSFSEILLIFLHLYNPFYIIDACIGTLICIALIQERYEPFLSWLFIVCSYFQYNFSSTQSTVSAVCLSIINLQSVLIKAYLLLLNP